MKKILVVLVSLLTMVAFASTVMAQTPAAPAPAAEKAAPAAPEKPKAETKKAPKDMKATGTVAGYEAGKMLKVKGKDKEMAFDVTGDTKVKGEIKDGAKVTVMYKKDGDKMVATSISGPAAKKSKEKK
jgi:Cu/Ag efflux protein CusF